MKHWDRAIHFETIEPGDATVYNLTIVSSRTSAISDDCRVLVFFGTGWGDCLESVDTFRYQFNTSYGIPVDDILHTIRKSNLRGDRYAGHEGKLLCGLLGAFFGFKLEDCSTCTGGIPDSPTFGRGFDWMTENK